MYKLSCDAVRIHTNISCHADNVARQNSQLENLMQLQTTNGRNNTTPRSIAIWIQKLH